MNNTEETARLQFQQIKNKFNTYEERRDKMIANNYELLRSQVESGYTPNYQTGAYIKPEAVIQYNDDLDNSDNFWRFWAVNLDQATSTVSVTFTVERSEEANLSFTASNLDAKANLTAFLDAILGGLGTTSPVVFEKHCDTCIVISTNDDSVITGVTASIN